jgi:hypothetical protein
MGHNVDLVRTNMPEEHINSIIWVKKNLLAESFDPDDGGDTFL